jgi:hypothetical protein
LQLKWRYSLNAQTEAAPQQIRQCYASFSLNSIARY